MDDYRNSPTNKFCADLFPFHRFPSSIKFKRRLESNARELIKCPFNLGSLSDKYNELNVKSEREIAKNSTSN